MKKNVIALTALLVVSACSVPQDTPIPLVYDVENSPLNFGENGRKTISDSLVYGEKRNTRELL